MANLVLPFSNFLSTFPRPFPVVNTDEQPNPGIFQHIGNAYPERSRAGAASRRRPTPDSHSAFRNSAFCRSPLPHSLFDVRRWTFDVERFLRIPRSLLRRWTKSPCPPGDGLAVARRSNS